MGLRGAPWQFRVDLYLHHEEKDTQIMASLQQLQQDLADVSTTVDSLAKGLDTIAAEIQALRDQVGSGGVITQADLDTLDATVQDIKTRAQAALTREQGL